MNSHIIDPIASLLGEWSVTLNAYSILFRLMASLIMSAVLGWERSSKRHSAGFRTFIVVTLAGTVVMMLDIYIDRVFGSSFFFLSAAAVISDENLARHCPIAALLTANDALASFLRRIVSSDLIC